MKSIFGLFPHSWHSSPKTLGISKVMRATKVSRYINEVTVGPHLSVGAGCGENQPCDQTHSLTSGKEKVLGG